MTSIEAMIFSIGGNTVALSIVAYLAKILFEKSIARDTKIFETNLKLQTDLEIERLKSEMLRNIESHKLRLKLSETFFQHELKAASALTAIVHRLLPNFDRAATPWHQLKPQVAQRFTEIEAALLDFASEHSTALVDTELSTLKECKALSSLGQMYFNAEDEEISKDALDIAGRLYAALYHFNDNLRNRVRSQSLAPSPASTTNRLQADA